MATIAEITELITAENFESAFLNGTKRLGNEKDILLELAVLINQVETYRGSFLVHYYARNLGQFDKMVFKYEFQRIFGGYVKKLSHELTELDESKLPTLLDNCIDALLLCDGIVVDFIVAGLSKIIIDYGPKIDPKRLAKLTNIYGSFTQILQLEDLVEDEVYIRAISLNQNIFPVVYCPKYLYGNLLKTFLKDQIPGALLQELNFALFIVKHFDSKSIELQNPDFVHRVLQLFSISPEVFKLSLDFIYQYSLCWEVDSTIVQVKDLIQFDPHQVLAVQILKQYLVNLHKEKDSKSIIYILEILKEDVFTANSRLYRTEVNEDEKLEFWRKSDTIVTVLSMCRFLHLAGYSDFDIDSYLDVIKINCIKVKNELNLDGNAIIREISCEMTADSCKQFIARLGMNIDIILIEVNDLSNMRENLLTNQF